MNFYRHANKCRFQSILIRNHRVRRDRQLENTSYLPSRIRSEAWYRHD